MVTCMERSPVDLEQIADWRNLTAAFHRASQGKRARVEVLRFASKLDDELGSYAARYRGRRDQARPYEQLSHPRSEAEADPCALLS